MQPQERHDIKSTADNTRNRSENKKLGGHEQVHVEKAGEGEIGKSIEERTKQEMTNKTKARTIVEDKWERNKYLQECNTDTIKDVIKIRLHICQMNCNYKRGNTDTKFPLCKKSEDTAEHVLEREKVKKFTFSKKTARENGKR